MLTAHFMQRVRERVGPHVCPFALSRHIMWCIENDVADYVGRVNRKGLRCFRFTYKSCTYYAVVDTDYDLCVTVMLPGYKLGREGKHPILLGEEI